MTPKSSAAFTVHVRFPPSRQWVRIGGFASADDAQEALERYLGEQRQAGVKSLDSWIQGPPVPAPHEGATF